MRNSHYEQWLNASHQVNIAFGSISLAGELSLSAKAAGVVLFAQVGGSSRLNQLMARAIREAGVGVLLFDLLPPAEEVIDRQTRHLRFDVPLLARRLTEATDWVKGLPETGSLRIGYLGTGVVAAAALIAAAEFGTAVNAVVSRGGRPDLANEALPRVFAPTLLIAGGLDDVILHLNQEALARLHCVKEFKIIPDATHLFEEPGKSEEVALLTAAWFQKYLAAELFV
ncbi:MAG TPA: dienelactone hydrolase family protein [Blastocatellia bacterium]|nr:dienelactone hydrolase family protein [Blastocatellia bacterium]